VDRDDAQLNKYACFRGVVVGAVCARFEEEEAEQQHQSENKMGSGDGGGDNENLVDGKWCTTRRQQSGQGVGICVGAGNKPDSTTPSRQGLKRGRLYIMTLAVLAPYRGRGIGSQLLESVLAYIEHSPDESRQRLSRPPYVVDEVTLHVHVGNLDAIRFYEERFDFGRRKVIENYYCSRRVDPPHCIVLFKKIARRGDEDDDGRSGSVASSPGGPLCA